MDSTLLPSQLPSTYILMLSASHMQCTSGFLVAFGGTGCRVSAGRLAPFVPQVLMLSNKVKNFQGGGGRGLGAWSPRKFIGLSKMQFPAFSGSELVNQDGILRH